MFFFKIGKINKDLCRKSRLSKIQKIDPIIFLKSDDEHPIKNFIYILIKNDKNDRFSKSEFHKKVNAV